MNAAENEAKTRRLYEAVWNERRLELIADWVAPGFVGHYSMYPEAVRGVDGFRAMVDEALAAMPDLRMEVIDTIAADDKVVSRVRMTGTHRGPLQGFAPSGRRIDVQYLAIERYGDDGRCVEEWVRGDELAVSRQIGALPAPGSLAERIGRRLYALRARRMRRG